VKRPGERKPQGKSSEEKTNGLRAQKGASLLDCVTEKRTHYKRLYVLLTSGKWRRRQMVFSFSNSEVWQFNYIHHWQICGTEGERDEYSSVNWKKESER
jgi:hypothetical protein